MKIGIIKEEKVPHDKRVPLIPSQCKELQEKYNNLEIWVQPSEFRCFSDSEYAAEGIHLSNNMHECDVLLGVKEVPIHSLIPNKTYLFFSHTIKKQPYNKGLLKEILNKNIQLVDYELLKDLNGNRIIGFGRYAGIVGTYNGIRAYGLRTSRFSLKPAYQCHDRKEVEQELKKVNLDHSKIVITGGGRVASGAMEILNLLKIKQVSPEEFLNSDYNEPVFTQLNATDYNKPKEGEKMDLQDFYANPSNYSSNFLPFTKKADILITCHYWDPASPILFTKEEMKANDFKIKTIADITCDINGSVPSTLRSSTIKDPFYGYDINSEKITETKNDNVVTVMAVDNLPAELPRDASTDFGAELIRQVLPYLIADDTKGIIERASITKNGSINKNLQYLKDWINEGE